MASSVNHTVRLPRWTNAASYSGQFATRYRALGILWRRLSLNLYGIELPELGVGSDQPTILPLFLGILPVPPTALSTADARNPGKPPPLFLIRAPRRLGDKPVHLVAEPDIKPRRRRMT